MLQVELHLVHMLLQPVKAVVERVDALMVLLSGLDCMVVSFCLLSGNTLIMMVPAAHALISKVKTPWT